MYVWVVFNWSVEFYVRPRDKQTSEYTTNEWYFYLLHFVIGSSSLLLLKKKKKRKLDPYTCEGKHQLSQVI